MLVAAAFAAMLAAAAAQGQTLLCTQSSIDPMTNEVLLGESSGSNMCLRYEIQCAADVPGCSLEDVQAGRNITWYSAEFSSEHSDCTQAHAYFQANFESGTTSGLACCQDADNCNSQADMVSIAEEVNCHQNATTGEAPSLFAPNLAYRGLYTSALTTKKAAFCARYDVTCTPISTECTSEQRRTSAVTTVYRAVASCDEIQTLGSFNHHCCNDGDLCNDPFVSRQIDLQNSGSFLKCYGTDIANPSSFVVAPVLKGVGSCVRATGPCSTLFGNILCSEAEKQSGSQKTVYFGSPLSCADTEPVFELYGQVSDFQCCADRDACNYESVSPPPTIPDEPVSNMIRCENMVSSVLTQIPHEVKSVDPATTGCIQANVTCTSASSPSLCSPAEMSQNAKKTIFAAIDGVSCSTFKNYASILLRPQDAYKCCNDRDFCSSSNAPSQPPPPLQPTISCIQNDTRLGQRIMPPYPENYEGLYSPSMTITKGPVCIREDIACNQYNPACSAEQARSGAITTLYTSAPSCEYGIREDTFNFHCCNDRDECNSPTVPRSVSISDPSNFIKCKSSDFDLRVIKGVGACIRANVTCRWGTPACSPEEMKTNVSKTIYWASTSKSCAWAQDKIAIMTKDVFCCNNADQCSEIRPAQSPPGSPSGPAPEPSPTVSPSVPAPGPSPSGSDNMGDGVSPLQIALISGGAALGLATAGAAFVVYKQRVRHQVRATQSTTMLVSGGSTIQLETVGSSPSAIGKGGNTPDNMA